MTISQLQNDIEKRIQKLPTGIFEDLVQRLLPLISKRYQGIRRNGRNEDSKTRRGTPDIIKTFDNGNQIAVECSTQKDYWRKSKPISDIKKCMNKLAKLVEIVLASSQPFHPDPNIEYRIRSAFQEEPFKIKFFTSEDLAFWIKEHIPESKVYQLIKDFFPDILNSLPEYDLNFIIKGGDSFCYLTLDSVNEIITIIHQGKYTLYNIQARIVDVEKFKQTSDIFTSDIFKSQIQISYPELTSNQAIYTEVKMPLSNKTEQQFNIFWSARNGFFTQKLKLRKVSNKWLQATIIEGKFTNEGSNKVLLKKIDEGFLTNKDEQLEWT